MASRESSSKNKGTKDYRYSVLQISDKFFGVEVLKVREVVSFPKLTIVPNVNESVLGVFNLRGQIFSVMDIRLMLKLPVTPLRDENLVVILEQDDVAFGIVVDKVMDVANIDSNKIQIPTREMPVKIAQYLDGCFDHKKFGMIYLLDISALVNAKELKSYRF
ncbi:MAG: chemotaxis protein CheW [Calditrichaceae bacterium]